MGFPRKNFSLIFFLVFFQSQLRQSSSSSDYATLVYKGCSKDTFTDPNGVYSQALSSLFGSLVAQSTKTKFYKATSVSAQTALIDLFQCRGGLTNSDCYNCVSRLPVLADKLCGKTVASKVQLLGCYISTRLSSLLKSRVCKCCTRLVGRGHAFSELASGVVSNHGFYMTSYQSVYVLEQCEGDIGDSDCGECVKKVVQRAGAECGRSVSLSSSCAMLCSQCECREAPLTNLR